MPERFVPPLVQPLAPEVLEEWRRSGAAGWRSPSMIWIPWPSPSGLLQWASTWKCPADERKAELLLADGHRLVFPGFGHADSTRDPAWDVRLDRLLALAKGAQVWVKLSGIGRVTDRWAQAVAGRMLEELAPERLLWAPEWPHITAAHAYAPTYAQTLEWLDELVPGEDARKRILGDTPAALYGLP
ncbi:amidohydrolase family protein [Bradyrhizobium sp. ARR65]|uniref:amidohydrolase family protein n=1 Tax=Bradyrhizobium sp. ARR65 TaxID=1040989 RepID=UPI0004650BE8|nr:amidohydrolase family protein [Bradyrhizobium sp. ARR65]